MVNEWLAQGSYFFTIGLDLLNNKYSPYPDGYGHAYPIIRGGFDIYLKPSKKSTPSGPHIVKKLSFHGVYKNPSFCIC